MTCEALGLPHIANNPKSGVPSASRDCPARPTALRVLLPQGIALGESRRETFLGYGVRYARVTEDDFVAGEKRPSSLEFNQVAPESRAWLPCTGGTEGTPKIGSSPLGGDDLGFRIPCKLLIIDYLSWRRGRDSNPR